MHRSVPTIILTCFAAAQLFAAGETTALAASPTADGQQFLMWMEPPGAVGVVTARKEAQDQEDVVVVGRIGGKKVPWIRGMAAFLIVDCSLKPCSELADDHCAEPWDYCCAPNLAKSIVLVKVVDASGNIVRQDARELLGVKELDTVVVQGKARRDKAGNVSIVASKIYHRDDEKAIR
jgi:hypothetical protein